MPPHTTREFTSAYIEALTAGKVDVVHRLIDTHRDIAQAASLRDSDNATALHLAAEADAEPVVRLLLANGADPTRTDWWGRVPLWRALLRGATRALAVLLPATPGVSRRDLANYAVEIDQPGALRVLLDEVPCPAFFSGPPSHLLHLAAEMGRPECIRHLLDAGFDIDLPDHLGRTPLYRAALAQKPDALRVLLEAGANPDAPSASGTRPFEVIGKDRHDHRKTALCREMLLPAARQQALRARGALSRAATARPAGAGGPAL